MSKFLAASAALCSLAFATSAFAGSMTATLEQPVMKPTKVIAGGALWSCDGNVCRAPLATERATDVSSCASLAKEVGRVAGYGDGLRDFAGAQLTKCNAHLAAPSASIASAR